MPPVSRVTVRGTKVRAATARTSAASFSAASAVLKDMCIRASAHGATELADNPPLTSPVLTMVSASEIDQFVQFHNLVREFEDGRSPSPHNSARRTRRRPPSVATPVPMSVLFFMNSSLLRPGVGRTCCSFPFSGSG